MERWLVIWYDKRYSRYDECFFENKEDALTFYNRMKELYPNRKVDMYLRLD